MSDDDAAPELPDSPMLAALDLPDACRAGVALNLALLAEHWRRVRDDRA